MIEVIAVMVILAILGVVGYSTMSSTSTFDLKSRVDVLKGHLRYAQTRAMNSNQIWGISFPSNTAYALFRNGDTANRVLILGQDADIVSLPGGFSVTTGIVAFDDWGIPYTDASGTTAQSGSRTISLSKDGVTENITIMPNTGFIP